MSWRDLYEQRPPAPDPFRVIVTGSRNLDPRFASEVDLLLRDMLVHLGPGVELTVTSSETFTRES